MQDMEKLGRELFAGERGRALRDMAASGEARRLEAALDPAEVERAARSGDPEAIRALLTRVLSTAEGRAVAEKLSRMGF